MRYLQTNPKIEKTELDVKDKKILSILAENSRLPSTAIARKVGLSRDSIAYRVSNLEKRGVIQGYRTIVDIEKFGYEAYHIFLQLISPSKEIENKIIKKIQNYPFVRAILKFNGKYDFELAVIAKNLKDLDAIMSKILYDCSGYLQDYEILGVTSNLLYSTTLPRAFFNIQNKERLADAKTDLDSKDIKLLRIIADNADLPLYEIGSRLNLSADAINYRIKKMISSGIIRRFVPVVNYAALSYSTYVLLLRTNNLDEKLIKQFIDSDKNIFWAAKTTGKFNLVFYVLTKTTEELHETVNNLRRIFGKGIIAYETLIAYEEYKYTYFPSVIKEIQPSSRQS